MNRISGCGKLGQVFVIDHATRIQHDRLAQIEKHHTQFLTSTKKKLLEAFQRIATRHNRLVGCVTSIPSTVKSSPKCLQMEFENTITMANQLGRPDIFLTFTCSTSWFELKENIKCGLTWADNSFLLNEVFEKKKESLLNDVIGNPVRKGGKLRKPGCFGAVKWFAYSIEFQQRGPPHMHLIISLVNHVQTVQQIDAICSAELPVIPAADAPEFEATVKLRELVEKYMVHTPCLDDDKAYCNEGKKPNWKTCKKHFPKPFNEVTELGDRDYPALYRPDNGEFVWKRRNKTNLKATNQYVVAYNPFLLSKYQCHNNIEVISSIKVVKYIFKYLYKGFDRALIEAVTNVGIESTGSYGVTGEMTMQGHILLPKNLKMPPGVMQAKPHKISNYEIKLTQKRLQDAKNMLKRNNVPLCDENGRKTLVYNECHFYEDMRAMTAPEAAWEIAGYPKTGSSHNVTTVFVHRPQEEPISMQIGEDVERLQERMEEDVVTMLKAFFNLCASNDPHAEDARQMTFNVLPKKFTYNKGVWRWRKYDYSAHILGRIKFVRPRYLEQFAIRLLCMYQKGPKSFEDLRTVNGVIYEGFVEAARALRLMNDEAEWDMCLAEAATIQIPIVMRRLFTSILLNCAPANPLRLWLNHKAEFYENRHWSDETKEAHALFHIRSALEAHGCTLSDYNLPGVNMCQMPHINEWVNDARGDIFTVTEAEMKGQVYYERLTKTQRTTVDRIVNSVDNNTHESFFIEGKGGCGKTFVYKCLYYILEGKGYKVMCVAHTGVAASLIPQGTTVHRAFGIPLTVDDDMHCKIDLESVRAEELMNITIVLWDEAPMTDRRIFSAVHELFSFLHPEQGGIFGGTTFVFGGDWHQTLPIVEGIEGPGVIDYTLIRSDLWNKITSLHLKENIRAREDRSFSAWICEIGEGRNYLKEHPTEVEIPEKYLVNTETELINTIFGDGKIEDDDVTSTSCILSVDNATSLGINNRILQMKSGTMKEYYSRDLYDEDVGFSALDDEVYNTMTPAGMPQHRLCLKEGAVLILLKNISVYLGICNGLRLRVMHLGEDMIKCQPINGAKYTPPIIVLHRMAMKPSKSNSRELSFIRWQFPVRLAYAMTINKSQGQTLGKVGLLLRTPVFSHGQLYVALSRVRNEKSLLVHNESSKQNNRTRNVVYKEVLPIDNNE